MKNTVDNAERIVKKEETGIKGDFFVLIPDKICV